MIYLAEPVNSFWQFLDKCLDRLPGWPSEREGVTIAMFALDVLLLVMAINTPALWDVEVFKVIIQAVTLTGLLNMILAFHFAANKGDETRMQNTGKALDALKVAQQSAGPVDSSDTIREGDSVTLEKK